MISIPLKQFSILLCLSLTFLSCSSAKVQDAQLVKLIDGKTDQQIIEEYTHWSKTKNDWANLTYYQEANSQLKNDSNKGNRVIFMGNSITEMWKVHSPDFFKNRDYINRGISGQTTAQILLRFRQDVIDLKPKIVVLLAGTNDIAGNTGPTTNKMIENNIFSMVELAQTNGINVIMCSVLPTRYYFWVPEIKPSKRIVALNASIQKYARQHNIPFVDYFCAMADDTYALKKEYSIDGVHPNQKGYNIMGPLVEIAINQF